jgi:hypothetical protein
VVHHPVVVEYAARRAADVQLRIADAITAFAGSMPFVYIHVLTTEIHEHVVGDEDQRSFTALVSPSVSWEQCQCHPRAPSSRRSPTPSSALVR